MKTVIAMAEECGIPEFVNNESQAENIIRFAELVRKDYSFTHAQMWLRRFDDAVKAERKAMQQLFTDPENQPTQYGTVTLEYMQREIASEREACAGLRKEVELRGKWPSDYEDGFLYALEKYEDMIRKRNNT